MPDYIITATAEQDAVAQAVAAASELSVADYLQDQFDRQINAASIKSNDRRWDALDSAAKETALTAGEAV